MTLEQFAVLNGVWAATIVLLEVPSGAIADILGRRGLILFANVCMVLEMALMAFVPLGNPEWVFYALMFNRVISEFAEATASGADEALAFDSLKAEGLEARWSEVLKRLSF